MKVGDLVRPLTPNESHWKGIIIDWEGSDPVVFWNKEFPEETEYKEQIEVING